MTAPTVNDALDERDRALLADLADRFHAAEGDRPRVGEWVRFAGGELRRICHVWWFPEDKDGPAIFSVQTARGGSFHLGSHGASMSGSLDPGVPGETFTVTDERRDGSCWIWHHGWPGKDRGVPATVPFRVWASTEQAPR